MAVDLSTVFLSWFEVLSDILIGDGFVYALVNQVIDSIKLFLCDFVSGDLPVKEAESVKNLKYDLRSNKRMGMVTPIKLWRSAFRDVVEQC